MKGKQQHQQDLTTVGKRIRKLRKQAGFSQEAFAHYAQIDRGYMGKIERGETNITLATLSLICLALDIGMEKLTHGLPTKK